MFAILKFQKHTEAATVSRAIVLSVKIFKDESYMPDGVVIHSETEPKTIKSLNHTNKDNGRKNIESEFKVETKTSNADELQINTTDINKDVNNLSSHYDPNNWALSNVNNKNTTDKANIIECNRKISTNVSLINESVNIENKDAYKNKNCSISFKEGGVEKNEYQNNIEKSSLSNKIEFQEIKQREDTELQQMNNNSANNTINSNDEGVTDSVNLPYQYLIEKEIESAKKKVVRISLISINGNQELNADSTTKSENKHIKKVVEENNENNKNYKKHKVSETAQSNEEQSTKSTKYLSAVLKEWVNDHDKVNKDHNKSKRNEELEKKIDDNTVKSSNITDLIMEGRMFMIQQDQDIVSVVEQKTKSDIDEVLENSEKFETKDGEKCLLNSSLLKLENLITMIEVPKESIKSNYESKITINNLSSNSIFITEDSVNDQCIETPINVMNPSTFIDSQNIATSSKSFIYNEENESNMKNVVVCDATTKCEENVLENIENEQNNITSAIQYWNESTNLFKETSNSFKRQDIKDDSITTFEHEFNAFEDYINSGQSKLVEATDNWNINSNNVSNVPRIISSQIITIDQMPLALQNIVKEKLSKRNRSVNHESNPHDTSSYTTRLTSSNNSTVVDVTSTIESSDTELSNVKKCSTPSPNNTVTKCDNASPICSNIEDTEETKVSCKKTKKSNDYDAEDQSTETENNKTTPSTQRKTYCQKQRRKHRKRKKQQDCKYNTKMKVKMMKMSTNITDAVKTKNSTVPNKLQDITDEFYQDLMQHGKHSNNTFEEKSLRHTRRSLYLQTDVKNEDKRIKMLKFIEDITRGVKVVVKRMSIENITSILKKNSSLAYVN